MLRYPQGRTQLRIPTKQSEAQAQQSFCKPIGKVAFPPSPHHPLALRPNRDIPNNEVHDTTRAPCTDDPSSLHHPLKATAELSALASLSRHPPGSPGVLPPKSPTSQVCTYSSVKRHGWCYESSNGGAKLTSTQWSRLMPCGSLQSLKRTRV